MGSDTHVVAQPRRDTMHDQIGRKQKSPASTGSNAAGGAIGSRDWRAGRIREWLLLLLRFAITRDPNDEAAALAMADEIDAIGQGWRPSAPSFFGRTSDEVCKAIATPDDPKRAAILKNHIARIDDARLQRAFKAAVEPVGSSFVSTKKQRDLWAGLRK